MLLIIGYSIWNKWVFETVGPSAYCWIFVSWSQSASQRDHAAQVTDSGECVTQPLALQVKLIKVLFWTWTWVGPRNHLSAGSPDPPPRFARKRHFIWTYLGMSKLFSSQHTEHYLQEGSRDAAFCSQYCSNFSCHSYMLNDSTCKW